MNGSGVVDARRPLLAALLDDTADQVAIVTHMAESAQPPPTVMMKHGGSALSLPGNGGGKLLKLGGSRAALSSAAYGRSSSSALPASSASASAVWTAQAVEAAIREVAQQLLAGSEDPTALADLTQDIQQRGATAASAADAVAVQRERATQALEKLEQQLAAAKQAFQQQHAQQQHTIAQLEFSLHHHLVPHSQAQMQYARRNMRATEQAHQLRHAHCHQHQHAAGLLFVEQQLAQEHQAHQDIMAFVGQQLAEARDSLQAWIERFERDTEYVMQRRIDDLKQTRLEVGERYAQFKAECDAMQRDVEAHRLEKEKQRLHAELTRRQHRAAVRLQRWWRRLLLERKKKKAAAKAKKAAKKKK